MPPSRPGEALIFIDDAVDWDDPRRRPDEPRSVPRPRAPVARRPPARTLTGDLARLRERARRNARALVLVAVAVAVAALLAVAVGLAATSSESPAPAPARGDALAPLVGTAGAAVAVGISLPGRMATLEPGDRGAAVRELQARLAALGYSTAVDGVYGPGTAAAVAQFQTRNGLTADGVVGPLTARSLTGAVAARPNPASEIALIDRGLDEAVGARRLTEAAARRYGRVAAAAAETVRSLEADGAAVLRTVLDDVGAQAAVFDTPRTLTLFSMLELNRARLAAGEPVAATEDVEGEDGIVYRPIAGHGLQFHPLANFARLNALAGAQDRERARALASALVARGIQTRDGLTWEYYFPFRGPARWTSGFVQAVAAQSLARAAELGDDDAAGAAAREAARAIETGLARPLGGGLWILEYGFSELAILNAQLQSLVSLRDYAARTEDARADDLVARLDAASRKLLPRFDTGCWSLYALGGERASEHYHRYHVQLLGRLAATTGESVWREARARWARYLRRGGC